jgi:Ca-activated chloride channel family protein
MFHFEWPWMAILLLLPLVARRYWPRQGAPTGNAEPGRPTLLHPALAALAESFGAITKRRPFARSWRWLLLASVWTFLVLAMMRPQWLQQHTEIESRGYDLMLAIDGSRSMEAMDFTVNGQRVTRMAVVKGVLGRFIDERRGDRIGLILFGDQAHVMAPLTLDGSAIRALLDKAVARMAGDATAIGDAIGLAVKKLREQPEGSRVLILVTDGENTSGSLPPRLAAQLAAAHQIRIYTIGVGTTGPVPIFKDGRLTRERMDIDESLLRDVAGIAQGAYFRATDTRALEEIYQRIDALEKTEAKSRSLWVPEPLYRWPLGMALLGLLCLGVLPGALGARSEMADAG